MIHIGTRVKVIDQDITGTVVRYDTGNKVVVLDDNRDEWRFDIEPEGEEEENSEVFFFSWNFFGNLDECTGTCLSKRS